LTWPGVSRFSFWRSGGPGTRLAEFAQNEKDSQSWGGKMDTKWASKLIEYGTRDWTEADWESHTQGQLIYHIGEMIENRPDLRDENILFAWYEFEKYMGWA
jgi:hypothetical protein